LRSIGISDTLVSDEYVEQLMDTDDNKLSDTDESSNTDIYLLYLLDGKVLSFSKMTRMEMLKKLKEEN